MRFTVLTRLLTGGAFILSIAHSLIAQPSADFERSKLLHEAGKEAFARGDLERAIDNTKEALRIRIEAERENPDEVLVSAFNLGAFHHKAGELDQALRYYGMITERAPNRKEGEALFQIGRIYGQRGELEAGAEILASALNLPPFRKSGLMRNLALEQLALIHLRKENQNGGQAALPLLRESLANYSEKGFSFLNAKILLGRSLYLTGDFTGAISVLNEAIQHNELTLTDKEIAAQLHTTLGIAYRRGGNNDMALAQHYKALALDLELAGANRPDDYVASDYNNLSTSFLSLGQADSALIYAEKSIAWSSITSNYPLKRYTYLLDLARAQTALAQKNEYPDYEPSLNAYHAADRYLDHMRRDQFLKGTRAYWRADALTLYREAIDVALVANQPEDVYYFVERARARLLLDELTAGRASESLPPEVANRLDTLARAVRYGDHEPQQLEKFRRYQDSVFQDFPDYRDRQIGPEPLTVAALRQEMGDQTLVEYYTDPDHTLAVVLQPGEALRIVPLAPMREWQAQLQSYIRQLSRPDKKFDFGPSHQLYRILIEPLQLTDLSRLTIVSTGDLHALPLGALLTDEPTNADYQDWPWLARVAEINYAFSAQLLHFAHHHRHRGNGRALALAPVARLTAEDPLRTELELPATLRTLRFLAEHFPTDTLVNAAANREAFASQANDYTILHLGTHAYLSDQQRQNSFLLHDEDFAYYDTRDLADHHFRSDLVVIAGCQTGIGREMPGEGIASLGRAFARRGAPNLALSLWQIDDAATADLLEYFYQGVLAENYAPGKALTLAQRKFLQEQTNPAFGHPHYWAGMVYYGVERPLLKPANTRWWPIALLVAGIGLWYVVLRRRKFKPRTAGATAAAS